MINTKSKKNAVAANAGIKVIKKGEKNRIVTVYVKRKPKSEVASQMAATVMNWVKDFENRKLEEARLSIKRFQHIS